MHAFGLRLDSAFAIAGLDRGPEAGRTLRRARIDVAAPDDLDVGWDEAERVVRREPGGPIASVDHHPEWGYRMVAEDRGRFAIAGDGSRIACEPHHGVAPWLFQRFLCGEILPFAAVLRGLEAFRASAAVIDGRVVAFAGYHRAGKTSLAAQLAVRGAGFLTDDALVVEPRPDAVLCHPGPGVANVRNPQLRRLAQTRHAPFRGVIAGGGGTLRVLVDRVRRPYPLGAIYFLEPGHEELAFEQVHDPCRLIGHTFNVSVRTPERLTAQLDSCARVAGVADLFRATVPAGTRSAELAEAIEAHVRRSVAAAC